MSFIRSNIISIAKSITALMFLAFLLTSCAVKIPDYPEIPEKMDLSQMAQVKLITLNQEGFNEQFGGTALEFFLVIPYFKDSAGISFNKEYIVKVNKTWETSNGKFFNRKYKFNDKAIFSVPAGTYEVCAHKIAFGGRDIRLKKCYENSSYIFEPGQKYEIYIYYRADSTPIYKGTRYVWYLKVDDIKKVDEFKPTPMFMAK